MGRSVPDLLRILGELRAHDVGLYLHDRGLHLTTNAALFEMLDLLLGYDKAIARERIIAGQRRAALNGVRIGRPPLPTSTLRRVRAALDAGRGIRETARLCAQYTEDTQDQGGDGGHRQHAVMGDHSASIRLNRPIRRRWYGGACGG